MNAYKEKLIEMVEIAEAQMRLIKVATALTDVHLFPQIQAIREAKELLEEEEGANDK